MKCVVCGCTDDRACVGGCSWIADSLCSNCGVILAKPYIQELIDMLKKSGINSKQKVIEELQSLFEKDNSTDIDLFTLFEEKYLSKFEQLIDKEEDLDINLYSYPITKGYTGIDYFPEDKEFYFFDGTNKRKLSLEDTMTIIDIFEKGRTIR